MLDLAVLLRQRLVQLCGARWASALLPSFSDRRATCNGTVLPAPPTSAATILTLSVTSIARSVKCIDYQKKNNFILQPIKTQGMWCPRWLHDDTVPRSLYRIVRRHWGDDEKNKTNHLFRPKFIWASN